MDAAPVIITVTELRRSAARIIGGAVESGDPVFVTQNGHVTAVLLSRERYERLLHPAMSGSEPEGEAGSVLGPGAIPPRPGAKRFVLVQTPFGLCDPETAAFLAEEGFSARTPDPTSHSRQEADSTPDGAGSARDSS